MGDQRREDTAKAHRDDRDPVRNADADRENEEGFDTGHARKQMQMRTQARGPGFVDLPERAFEGAGDQDKLWERFEALLGASTVSDEVLQLVRDMDGGNRRRAGLEVARVAKVVTGGDLLVFAELTSIKPGAAVDAALTAQPKPTAAEMRAYLSRIEEYLLVDQLGDAATVAKLRATYTSPIAILPRLPQLLANAELASWYLNHTPAEQVAMAMVRLDGALEAARVAKHLDQVGKGGRGGWQWAFHVTEAMTSLNVDVVQGFAKAAQLPDVAEFLQRRVDAYNATGANVGEMSKATREIGSELKKGKPAIDDVVDDLGVAVGLAEDELRKHRTRFLASATTAQIDQATELAAFKPAERLRWLLDGKRVQLDELRDVLASWNQDHLRDGLDLAHVDKIRKRWPAAAPADVFGRVPDTLYGELAKSGAVRTWIVKTGQPNDILHLLAFWPGRTAEMCKWVDAHAGWDWLDRVGGGTTDHELRIVALNCRDEAISKRIQKYHLGDAIESATVTPQPIDRAANEDPNARFDRELRYKRDRDLADAAGELRPEDVAELQRDPEKLKQALAATKGKALTRIVYLLEPPLRLVLTRGGAVEDTDALHLAGWVRSRAGTDVVDALSDHTAARRAMALWPRAPLEIFPQLRQAAVLAPVLDTNVEVLRWILETSEPMSALHAIAASGVAKITVEALEVDEELVQLLPSGKRLSPRERTYLYGLANNATGSLKQALMTRIEAEESEIESDVDERAAGDDRKERDKAGFAEALEALLDDASTPVEDILTLCRERGAEASRLVVKRPELVVQALARTKQAPTVVFPTVALHTLLGEPDLVEPTLDSVPNFIILREAATNAALATLLAAEIDKQNRPFQSWLRRLPTASGLSPIEQTGLRKLFDRLTSAVAAREAFKARFGSFASEDYDRAEIGRLWSTLERLPRAHADQGAVSGFHETQKPVDGEFDPSSRGINMHEKIIERTGDKDTNPVYNRTDAATTTMTAAEAKAAFGLDDAQLAQWVADKRLVVQNGVYQVNPQPQPDRFTGTALHEIGHAVDQMLGSNTELVFGLAGWKQYGDADFDGFANDLGGWDRVTAEDKKKIREAWQTWSNSTQATGRPGKQLWELVPSDHPAVKAGYTGVGIVDFATDQDKRGSSDKPFLRNGRAYIMNGVYQRTYSLPMRTVHSAPSEYSLTAPEEYFAECYMTYYLTYDGTSKTVGDKGKLLAPWIKKWFDDHIDKIGHNPKKGSY